MIVVAPFRDASAASSVASGIAARLASIVRGARRHSRCAPAAHAAPTASRCDSASIELTDEGWQLNADFDVQFSPRLEEAVNRGVPLYFVVEFEIARPRWYWFDEKPVKLSQTYKISYTPLLRQYRLSIGNVYQNFTRFDEVTRVLSRVRGLAGRREERALPAASASTRRACACAWIPPSCPNRSS